AIVTQRRGGKCVIRAFQFLQTNDVWLRVVQPTEEIAQPAVYIIDVERTNLEDLPHTLPTKRRRRFGARSRVKLIEPLGEAIELPLACEIGRLVPGGHLIGERRERRGRVHRGDTFV